MDLGLRNQYIDRIIEQEHLIDFQKMVLDISFEFMNINRGNFRRKVDLLLENIGIFFEVDRTYLFTIDYKKETMRYSNEWCNKGIRSEMAVQKDTPLKVFPWWHDQLHKNKLIYIDDVANMPKEARAEQIQLISQGIKSSISVPVMFEGRVYAFIGIDSVKSRKTWSNENIELLYTMAQILSRGMTEINYDMQIDFMAYYDPLTRLPNHSLLDKKLSKGIINASHNDTPVSILFIDLDGFKVINDSLGHKQGDQLLKQVAKRLLEIVEKSEVVSRRGGDEFIVYLNNYKNEAGLEAVASEVMGLFKDPFILKDQEYFITASIGIAQYPEDGEDVQSLIRNADMAMYEAKRLGKNQYIICSKQLKLRTVEEISLTNDLYHAIEQKQMKLYFQPQVKGVTGEVIGAEALLRWKHPGYGFVPPNKFIPLAEKTRLILPIGYWVLKTACEQWIAWQEKGFSPIKIAVNFSGHQLNHPDIIEQIEEILENTAMPTEYLEIEITESVAMDHNDMVKERLSKIKEMGIHLSIDDYGKEYSSLKRLKESSVDAMKIDMSFVQGIGVNPEDEIIVNSLLSLASNLGIDTVAEGVETKEQLDYLNQTSCDLLQGYYFHRPMPADELEQFLHSGY